MPVSNYLNEQLTEHTLRGNIGGTSFSQPSAVYLALHKSNPTADGDTSTELSGGSYGRLQATFATFAGTYVANNATISFASLPSASGGITHWSIWDDPTAGNMLFYDDIPAADIEAVNNGDTYTVNTGVLKIGFKVAL